MNSEICIIHQGTINYREGLINNVAHVRDNEDQVLLSSQEKKYPLFLYDYVKDKHLNLQIFRNREIVYVGNIGVGYGAIEKDKFTISYFTLDNLTPFFINSGGDINLLNDVSKSIKKEDFTVCDGSDDKCYKLVGVFLRGQKLYMLVQWTSCVSSSLRKLYLVRSTLNMTTLSLDPRMDTVGMYDLYSIARSNNIDDMTARSLVAHDVTHFDDQIYILIGDGKKGNIWNIVIAKSLDYVGTSLYLKKCELDMVTIDEYPTGITYLDKKKVFTTTKNKFYILSVTK